ncbi:adhesin transport system membrane fusion protein [Hoeflea marina]|uniref:Membrane fusion protein (MFP) family protein n=1 Tax=Hoeflea marina TaxID=274592 RepID=A0A317PT79_9HYPH|nr:HlyD family type I secretion periplasmic adaptor subunit [Hoeflea marina]PWW04137.1 adhesin transport system membrane fusion protein [Hoeflea marina]
MRSDSADHPPLAAQAILFGCVLTLTLFLGWSAFAHVEEIARGDGKVIPLSKTQIVQASEPGVVQEIAVKLGETVRKGQLLVRLDDTSTKSSLGESQTKSDAARATIARLEIEIDDLFGKEFACPEEARAISSDICRNEALLLAARRDGFTNKASVLEARRDQRRQEIDEARTSIANLDRLIAAMQAERDQIAPLVKRGIHPEINLLRLDREMVQQQGQRDAIAQSLFRLESQLKEAQLQIEELKLQFRVEARRELSQTLAELGVLQATISGASDRVRRTDVVSPVDGIINTLDVNTIGAFLQPGAVVAGVVPVTETLLVEARISPRDVAFVQPGQRALVKISAYDFSIFGGLEGKVSTVSADSLVDAKTGETYYEVLVQTGDSKIGKNGKVHAIRPGMVATVEIITGDKTVLDYLVKPFNKARYEAMTER